MTESERVLGTPTLSPRAHLGQGTKVTGKFFFEGTTTIEGSVSGEIKVHGHLIVGEHGSIEAKVTATSVLILGKILGDVISEKKIEIQPPGSLCGDITTPILVIADGAIFEGNSYMKRDQKEGKVLPLLRPEITSGSTEEPGSGL